MKPKMIQPPAPEHETESGYALAIETAVTIPHFVSDDDAHSSRANKINAVELYVRQSRKMIVTASSNHVDVFLVS